MSTQDQRQRVLANTLDRMKEKSHLPGDLVSLLGQTASLQLASDDGITLDCSNPEPFGLPLDLTHALGVAHKILDRILDGSHGMPPAMIKAAGILKQGLGDQTLDFSAAAAEVTTEAGPVIQTWSQKLPEAPGALRFLILAALEPSLRAGRSAMAELKEIQADEIHQTGACPICGHPPYILELRGKEGFRYGICSLCRFEYRIRRLACPVCDTGDPEHIKYFTVDQEPGFRVETCDHCHTYIKTIDFRNFDRESFASLNDLESLALDFLAEEQGYARSAPSVWGI